MTITTQVWDIALEGLTAGYGPKVVLENISTVLPGGKISMVLGGSGCGKSTLLRQIIGLSAPMEGKVLLGGNDFFAMKDAEFRRMRRRMGVLFQDGALLGSLTVGENIALPLREHTHLKEAEVQEIVLHKLSLVGLAHTTALYPSQLSGGMRKRAGLARALVTDPPILLCDEPTSGLDPISAAQMDALLLEMRERFPSMTIVCVSHDMESVKAIADHVLVLHEKQVIFQGSLHNLQETTKPYLLQFLARAPMREEEQGASYPLSEATRAHMHRELELQ
ncbi:ABC transporter ATP-binding protein [Desulfovibrio cuneatus]|uniref:ABC transporter ATP-binding protein n=1 Tax=Desulfovibrio cuneatus TaxID=159728 RepID=UPI00040660DF|nr:ATP-binding cassette domain-containing protein [Desulfovibrio cuneatus]